MFQSNCVHGRVNVVRMPATCRAPWQKLMHKTAKISGHINQLIAERFSRQKCMGKREEGRTSCCRRFEFPFVHAQKNKQASAYLSAELAKVHILKTKVHG